MDDFEAERIAAAIHVLRPDWPAKSLRTLMARPQLAAKPRRDVAVALTWIACETNTATPARVLESGPWWRACVVDDPEGSRPHPVKATDQCPRHPGQRATFCGGCRADELADDDERTTPTPAWTPGDATRGAAMCRAAIRGGTDE